MAATPEEVAADERRKRHDILSLLSARLDISLPRGVADHAHVMDSIRAALPHLGAVTRTATPDTAVTMEIGGLTRDQLRSIADSAHRLADQRAEPAHSAVHEFWDKLSGAMHDEARAAPVESGTDAEWAELDIAADERHARHMGEARPARPFAAGAAEYAREARQEATEELRTALGQPPGRSRAELLGLVEARVFEKPEATRRAAVPRTHQDVVAGLRTRIIDESAYAHTDADLLGAGTAELAALVTAYNGTDGRESLAVDWRVRAVLDAARVEDVEPTRAELSQAVSDALSARFVGFPRRS